MGWDGGGKIKSAGIRAYLPTWEENTWKTHYVLSVQPLTHTSHRTPFAGRNLAWMWSNLELLEYSHRTVFIILLRCTTREKSLSWSVWRMREREIAKLNRIADSIMLCCLQFAYAKEGLKSRCISRQSWIRLFSAYLALNFRITAWKIEGKCLTQHFCHC